MNVLVIFGLIFNKGTPEYHDGKYIYANFVNVTAATNATTFCSLYDEQF